MAFRVTLPAILVTLFVGTITAEDNLAIYSPLPKHLSNISLLTLCLTALRTLSTRSSLTAR